MTRILIDLRRWVAVGVAGMLAQHSSAATTYLARIQESARDSALPLAECSAGAPGHGYPGKILPYEASKELGANMRLYGLTAGWYVRDAVTADFSERPALDYYAAKNNRAFPDRVPFLLYAPKAAGGGGKGAAAAVPMLVFLPGEGEMGTDLNKQFNQKTIIEKVTSKAFQDRWPCYLLIPSPPEQFRSLMDGLPHRPSLAQNLINDAILSVALARQQPPVDTNRLYITGLSYGGSGAYAFGLKFPGRYAAVVPVSASAMDEEDLNPARPGNWWLFGNEGDYQGKGAEARQIEAFQSRVKALGGDFRIGMFPDGGHDAWNRAWREDTMWEWMFSKTADGAPVYNANGTVVRRAARLISNAPKPACTASVPGQDEGSGPERGADGLLTTAYVSARGLTAGEYWQAEFPEPVKGNFWLTLGKPDGSGAPAKAHVSVSEDGMAWLTVLSLRGKVSGGFTPNRPVRFLRIVSTAPEDAPEVLIVRNVVVE